MNRRHSSSHGPSPSLVQRGLSKWFKSILHTTCTDSSCGRSPRKWEIERCATRGVVQFRTVLLDSFITGRGFCLFLPRGKSSTVLFNYVQYIEQNSAFSSMNGCCWAVKWESGSWGEGSLVSTYWNLVFNAFVSLDLDVGQVLGDIIWN